MSRFCRSIFLIITIFITSCAGNPVMTVKNTETVVSSIPNPIIETPSNGFSVTTPTIEQEIHYGMARVPTKIDEMLNDLKDLSITEFFDRSFIFWLSRDPETISILGLSDELGIRNNHLTNISELYILDTEKLETAILKLLHTYNRDELTLEDQLNYDVYEWFWQDRVAGHAYRLYNLPVQSYAASSIPDQLVDLFINHHSIGSKEDIEDYISRINQIDEKIAQLIQELELRELKDVRPPRAVLIETINRYQNYLHRTGQNQYQTTEIVLYKNLKDKFVELDTLDAEEKQNYLDRTAAAIEASFIPAFSDLIVYLRGLLERSGDDVGVWSYAPGPEYYQYLIKHYTSLNLSPEQVANLGELELAEDVNLLQNMDNPNPDNPTGEEILKSQLSDDSDSGYYLIEENSFTRAYRESYQNILNDSEESLIDVFGYSGEVGDWEINNEIRPPVWLASNPSIAFIKDPWIFGYSDYAKNVIFLPTGALRTKIFSEEVPGYLFYLKNDDSEMETPLFRKFLTFNGYYEGWMGYAVNLMKDEGLFSTPEEEYFQIQRDAILSASMVIDSGIHYMGWTIGEGSNYLEDSAGFKRGSLHTTVERIAVTPGQVLSYKIGQLKFDEMRTYAENELGDKFSLIDYHKWLFSLGNIPLSVLEQQVQNYVIQQQKINSPNELP